jgi:hypothetical protein
VPEALSELDKFIETIKTVKRTKPYGNNEL